MISSKEVSVMFSFCPVGICGLVGRAEDQRLEGLGSIPNLGALDKFPESHTLPLCVTVRTECVRVFDQIRIRKIQMKWQTVNFIENV